MTDDGNDKASESQTSSTGAGKDVLFGWLVGRAAADLGLAQALAATEAEQAEKFKRLEGRLLVQIRELQSQSSSAYDSGRHIQELDKLKADLEGAVERLGGLESLARQMSQAPELLSSQIRILESAIGERQNLLETQGAQAKQLTEKLFEKCEAFERQISSPAKGLDRALTDLAQMNAELLALASRMTGLESSTEKMQDKAASDMERIQDVATALIRTETADIEGRILDRLGNERAVDTRFQTLQGIFERKLDDLRQEINRSTKPFNNLAADLTELHSRVLTLTKDVESVRSATLVMDLDTERRRLSQEINQGIAANLQEFKDDIRRCLQGVDDLKAKHEILTQGIETLSIRMGKVEQVAETGAAEVRRELDSVDEQRSREVLAQAQQLQRVDQVLGAKLQDIEKQLAYERQCRQGGESHNREFNDQLERVMARTAEIEAMAHQTRALMINESSQTAQHREGVLLELASLRAKIQETHGWDAKICGLEESLNMRLHDLENQLVEKVRALDSGQSEIGDLKAQLRNLNEKIIIVENRLPSPIIRDHVSASTVHELVPRSLSVEAYPIMGNNRSENVRPESQQLLKEVERRKEPAMVDSGDATRALQARISADIERARAELREKSGRWKLRQ